jgi:hypothetical protein
MDRRRGCIKWAVIALCSLVGLALLVTCPLALLYNRRLDQARVAHAPPTVYVTEPVPGTSLPAGSYVSVAATALGLNPIVRVELWMDGELVETQDSPQSEGISSFYAYFDLLLTEGAHMLFVRGVDTLGSIGQSAPVGIVGLAKADAGDTLLAVTVEEGETLEDIAISYGSDEETLQGLNPDLGGQEPVSGTVVIVPAPPEEQEEGATPSLGPSLPPTVPGTSPVPMPDGPPLQPIQPAPLPVGPGLVEAIFAPPPLPAAPTSLQAQVTNCKVRLTWNDAAANESQYEIWMAGLGLPERRIAILQPAGGGAVWYEFAAPQPGYFSFWVKAVNLAGGQPSNIVWVAIGSECPTTMATHLQVEALDMDVGDRYDRVYCYTSFEGAPETRLPDDDSAFIRAQGGQGEIAAWAAGNHKLVVPIPGDGALDIAGECWGWSGEALDSLGSFGGSLTSDMWDGSKHSLRGGACQIGVAIKPLGATEPSAETYCFNDPSLPAPYDVQEESCPSNRVECNYSWVHPPRVLRWKWDGDQKKITGFVIYRNGVVYNPHVRADQRDNLVFPGECGRHISWQVAAVAGEAQSALSAPFQYDQPDCQMYVRVRFEDIRLHDCRDGTCFGNCTLHVYYRISVNEEAKPFWNAQFPRTMSCSIHSFADLAGWYKTHGYDLCPDEITIPVAAYPIDLWIRTRFWEQDEPGADDEFAFHTEHFWWPSLEKAQDDLGDFGKVFQSGTIVGDDDAESTIWFRIGVFPNKHRDTPRDCGF